MFYNFLVKQDVAADRYAAIKMCDDADRRYIDISTTDKKRVSYYTSQKIEKIRDTQESFSLNDPAIRSSFAIVPKMGKLFAHLLSDYPESCIKLLVEKWNAQFLSEDLKFIILDDINDIINAYYFKNSSYKDSADNGFNATEHNPLSSCMRYHSCQESIRFYEHFNVSLLVLNDSNGKNHGRALIWHNVSFDTDKLSRGFMDRIYFNCPEVLERFIQYANDNDYCYKQRQSYDTKTSFVYKGNVYYDIAGTVTSVHNYEHLPAPYIDTFTYGDGYNLCNVMADNQLQFSNTDGTYQDNSQEMVWSDYHGGEYPLDDMAWCDAIEDYVLSDQVVSVEHEASYYPHDSDDITEVNGSWYMRDSQYITYCGSIGEYYLTEDTVYCETDGENYPSDDSDLIEIDGLYYLESDDTILEMDGEYYLLEDCIEVIITDGRVMIPMCFEDELFFEFEYEYYVMEERNE